MNGKRKIFIPPGISVDFRRLCNWLGKCVEIPLHYRKIRRSRFRAHLSCLSCNTRPSHPGNAVGRASQKSCASSFKILEPKGSYWHINGYVGMLGNYLLMMFYTTIGGWMLSYFVKMIRGEFEGLDAQGVSDAFNGMLSQPGPMILLCLALASALWGCKRA